MSAATALPASRPGARPAASPWPGRLLALAAALGLLWLVLGMVRAGNPLWALATLVLGGLALWVYATSVSLAWRYLFPGVVSMLIFIAFPLLYTVQLGFTNYSASHLLTEERARAYLLEQMEVRRDAAWAYQLHASGKGHRLVLQPVAGEGQGAAGQDTSPNTRQLLVSPLLDLSAAAPQQALALSPLSSEEKASLGPALGIREVIEQRAGLQGLKLKLPAEAVAVALPAASSSASTSTSPASAEAQDVLAYAGLREFAPALPVWLPQADGGLRHRTSGQVFLPNREQGYFENAQAGHLQPGFQVNVGFDNYRRLFGDPDMRGPFGAIFIWTVLFAGLTVVFAASLGMTLAVVLNWEALKYRTLYRTLLFLPYAVPGFISILVFKGLFNQNFGEINAILDSLFGIKPAWFADPLLAKTMLLIVNTWLGYPYFLVLCTGLIKAIPSDLYEASALAGASPWVNFTRLTVPLIAKPLTPLLISAFAFNFNNFVLISLLTDGRPDYLNTKLPAGTTDILVSYTYRIAFTDAGANFGLAAAISTVIFFLVALLSLANLKLTQSNQAKG